MAVLKTAIIFLAVIAAANRHLLLVVLVRVFSGVLTVPIAHLAIVATVPVTFSAVTAMVGVRVPLLQVMKGQQHLPALERLIKTTMGLSI